MLNLRCLALPLSAALLAACSSPAPQGDAPTAQPGPTATVAPAASSRQFAAASAHVSPDSSCFVHDNAAGQRRAAIVSDAAGVARFQAVRAATPDMPQSVTLDCTDAAGASASYVVDLASDKTFAPNPLDLATVPGEDRASLAGDPRTASQAELIRGGFGIRPDAEKEPGEYARWLKAATLPGRRLRIGGSPPAAARVAEVRPEMNPDATVTFVGSNWTGAVLTGDPSYDVTRATFNVPTAIPGGDGTSTTSLSLWNGLGGWNENSGLIQGGIFLQTSPTVAVSAIFREYCCGNPASNNYKIPFAPHAGDELYSQQWYCDAQGNVSLHGGYGCSYLVDQSTTPAAILSCTLPNDPNCWSVPALPNDVLGNSAEFILEAEIANVPFAEISPVTMEGSAHSTTTGVWETISTDRAVILLTDPTRTLPGAAGSPLDVNLGATDQVYFATGRGSKGRTAIDFDGDGKSDLTVFRPSNENWYVIDSSNAVRTTTQLGVTGDVPVPGDYDGDGKADVAVYRPSNQTWYILRSTAPGAYIQSTWGIVGDVPVPADYDGDGKTDIAVYRPSNQTWYLTSNGFPTVTKQWGIAGDVPVVGDYDGDGRSDLAVFRASTQTWYIIDSTTGQSTSANWGIAGDVPVPGDYDGDGKTDVAVWRPSNGNWYVVNSSGAASTVISWGLSSDVPLVGDFDGDGKTDRTVYRPSNQTWYLARSSGGTTTSTQWGITGDVPISGR